jgi:hypothetical protein
VSLPSLYSEHASWFHLLTSPADYEEEAALYVELLQQAAPRPLDTLLELGSGGGNNALWYKRRVPHVTLTDLSPPMLALSQSINPDCEHLPGDMRSLRLGRTFDAVFVHDAIAYLVTEEDLAACFATAAAHLDRAGVALFVPDCVLETFVPSTHTGGHDAPDGSRGLRYLEWEWDRDPADTTCQVDFACLLRDRNSVRAVHDHHECGVFPEPTWHRLIGAAGFDLVEARRLHWDDENDSQVAFLARKR